MVMSDFIWWLSSTDFTKITVIIRRTAVDRTLYPEVLCIPAFVEPCDDPRESCDSWLQVKSKHSFTGPPNLARTVSGRCLTNIQKFLGEFATDWIDPDSGKINWAGLALTTPDVRIANLAA